MILLGTKPKKKRKKRKKRKREKKKKKRKKKGKREKEKRKRKKERRRRNKRGIEVTGVKTCALQILDTEIDLNEKCTKHPNALFPIHRLRLLH